MSLVPLTELYAVDASPQLGFDVAGIRCAGLYTAQLAWAQEHGLRGPTAAHVASVELHLTRAELYRQAQGQTLTDAYTSTLNDVQRVMALYSARFANRDSAGQHPWEGDGLLASDAAYCKALSR